VSKQEEEKLFFSCKCCLKDGYNCFDQKVSKCLFGLVEGGVENVEDKRYYT
jgi:hypothetical protein